MRFRGVTLDGEFYEFTLTDCPIQLNDKMMALSNKPKSPLLLSKSLARMTDEGDLAEFDIVYDSSSYKALGFIVYRNEFGIYDHRTDTFTRLRDVNTEFGVLKNRITNYIGSLKGKMQQIRWKSGNVVFSVYEMLRIVNGSIHVTTKLTKPIDASSIRLCTGLRKDKMDLCYGDILHDGIIVLHDYHPMIKIGENEFRDFEEDEIDDPTNYLGCSGKNKHRAG